MTADEASAVAHLSARFDELALMDRVRQCAVDLMMCAGFRIGEVCSLPRDTWYEVPLFDRDGNAALGPDGQQLSR